MGDGTARKVSQHGTTPRRARVRVRPLVRALHRDAGYLAVGLTCVYALSGLAVNHIKDWDPNFDNYERAYHLGPIPARDDAAIAARVLAQLHIAEAPRDVYREADDSLSITFDQRSLHVVPSSGEVLEQGQKPRFVLRAVNYLHLNRGKRAWTYIADAYAVVLLGLALSGMFMLPGRKGLWGRGLILVLLGAALPILYVTQSG